MPSRARQLARQHRVALERQRPLALREIRAALNRQGFLGACLNSYDTNRSRNKLNRMTFVLREMKRALETGKFVLKRDIFYRGRALGFWGWNEVQVCNEAIDNIVGKTGYMTSAHGIVPSLKGLVAGPGRVVLTRQSSSSMDESSASPMAQPSASSYHQAGDTIPWSTRRTTSVPNLDDVFDIEVAQDLGFALMIESEAALGPLLQTDICSSLPTKGMLLTGKGYSDRATLALLSRLKEITSSLEVLMLMDGDPHGLKIARQVRRAVPSARFIGLEAKDLKSLPANCGVYRMDDTDLKDLDDFLKDPWRNPIGPELTSQACIMRENGLAGGLECLELAARLSSEAIKRGEATSGMDCGLEIYAKLKIAEAMAKSGGVRAAEWQEALEDLQGMEERRVAGGKARAAANREEILARRKEAERKEEEAMAAAKKQEEVIRQARRFNEAALKEAKAEEAERKAAKAEALRVARDEKKKAAELAVAQRAAAREAERVQNASDPAKAAANLALSKDRQRAKIEADDRRAESLLHATLEATEATGLSANEIVDIALKAVKNLDALGLLHLEKHAWRLTFLHELADAQPKVTNHGWGTPFNLSASSIYRKLHLEKPKKSIWET